MPSSSHIGTRTLAVASEKKVFITELAEQVKNIDKEKRIINRAMDRSRRATNPQNFDEKGRIIKLKKGQKRKWHHSNNYIKLRKRKHELERKQTAIRKNQHYTLANQIASCGDTFYIEKMNFADLKKRKAPVKNEAGKNLSTVNFGEQIQKNAPATLVDDIERKVDQLGGILIKVDSEKVKASQYSHITDEYVQKDLSQRWDKISDCQRDLYSAFLLKNMQDEKTIDKEKCVEEFDNFKKLHDEEIKRLLAEEKITEKGTWKVKK